MPTLTSPPGIDTADKLHVVDASALLWSCLPRDREQTAAASSPGRGGLYGHRHFVLSKSAQAISEERTYDIEEERRNIVDVERRMLMADGEARTPGLTDLGSNLTLRKIAISLSKNC